MKLVCVLIMTMFMLVYLMVTTIIGLLTSPIFYIVCISTGDSFEDFLEFIKDFMFYPIEMIEEM